MHTFSEQESLAVIQEMLAKSRKNTKDSSSYYLIWGWVILVSVIIEYILIQLDFEWHPAIWMISPFIGLAASLLTTRKMKKIRKTTTHFDRAMVSIWSGFGLLMILLMIRGVVIGISWAQIYLGIIALIGTTTFVSGKILEFRPLQVGGLATYVLCFVALSLGWTEDFPTMLLCIGVAMICSNLIPGYMLKRTIS